MPTSAISASPDLAEQYAAWACALRYADAPRDVRQALRNCLFYNLAMALAVDPADDPLGDTLGAVARQAGAARLFGGRGARSAQDAAFINAALVTARGQNDTHPDVVAHIGCIVIPAVLALADEEQAAWPDVLDALLAGYELIPRLARGMAEATSRRGLRATPLYGVLGAAVACARLLRLPVPRAAAALSIATQYACGTMQPWVDGSQEWRLQVAKASRDAVSAALLARAGLQGARRALEGDSGFARAYAGGAAGPADFSGWRLPEMAFKPYPGCAFNQAPVHALRELLRRTGIDPGQVAALEVAMHPFDAGYPGIDAYGPFPSPSGAIMSAPFMLAATLQDGQPGMAHFGRDYADGPLHARSARVRIRACETVARWACRVVATLEDGTRHEGACDGGFVLDWAQTVALGRAVSREWPGAGQPRRYAALARAVEDLEASARAGWPALQAAAYDQAVNDHA
ncbi:MmgE/PrpD family protein [Bordetella bronchiseptica]|uniref:MmgE/PrpD family protein n=1 Tax=Bordetella bronchiseptica TaxID=518 RepID=UPI00049F3407|nr:MmgE/PrpD family protein [Bordetella bronchiseptica]KDB68447.1 MmgE/PrpD family protein [Bordetella bronchiseptica A1-7]KDB68644.1 MmgE/PrpD family protein [Bordetella bronchiseptica B20-10725633]